jgi:hypothetical protein
MGKVSVIRQQPEFQQKIIKFHEIRSAVLKMLHA